MMRHHQSAWLGRVTVALDESTRRELRRGFIGGALRSPQLGAGPSSLTKSLRARGPILPVQIGLPQAAKEAGAEGTMEEIQALVDTGASITAVNMSVAARLGLIATGSVQIGGVTGSSQRPVYGARIVMPEPGFTFDPVQIVGADLNAPDFELLIGRNLLCSMMMTYDGPRGQFALTK